MLKLCADLANGSKHLVLTSTRTNDMSTGIARNDVNVFLGTGTASHRIVYVQSAGTEHDALDIAKGTVNDWTKFLTDNGLL